MQLLRTKSWSRQSVDLTPLNKLARSGQACNNAMPAVVNRVPVDPCLLTQFIPFIVYSLDRMIGMYSFSSKLVALCVLHWCIVGHAADTWQRIDLESTPEVVAPMTGIVLWDDNEKNKTDAIQLEYSYVGYDQVVSKKGVYDWQTVDAKLAAIASRGHQAVLRFYFDYVGKPTTVPAYIKQLSDYSEVTAKSEGKQTGFCDWSHPELQEFTLQFYSEFAKRYDNDRRLAFLQTGFGLWAEYHIYDGPLELGKTFPSKEFQSRFAKHLDGTLKQLPWMISIDAADEGWSPMAQDKTLRSLGFGLFDDSFLCKEHPKVNALNWKAFGNDRWQRVPAGGEFSYYNKRDQRLALGPSGPNGDSFEKAAARFHISFMIGDDQANYQSLDRIRSAGMQCGYKFHVEQLETNGNETRGIIINRGVAPIYFDAYPAILQSGSEVRSAVSLKHLQPGEQRQFTIPAKADATNFRIACDRLVEGQRIPFTSK